MKNIILMMMMRWKDLQKLIKTINGCNCDPKLLFLRKFVWLTSG